MMKSRFQVRFYFIYGIRNEFSVQKINGIINIGLGAALGGSTIRAAYQFK
jgi:hypothetical protein